MSKSGLAIAGMVLIIISLILTVIGLPVMFVYKSLFSSVALLGKLFSIMLVVQIVGIAFNLFALILTIKNMYKRAGVFAIIATFLPPLNLLSLVGGILCLMSKESRK